MADVSMPQEITGFMTQRSWGSHHLHWHVVRIWDLLDASTREWATQQGWSRYVVQEGEEANGLEFLAMHRVMIRTLTGSFPHYASLFLGWTSPPTDPADPIDPLPGGAGTAFEATMKDAISRLINNLETFDGEDSLGRFIETALRPFPNDVRRRSSDGSSGIHNYLHNRFQDPSSAINMGDPQVNIENERFWRLHGWIDSRWEAYRKASGRSNNDPKYLKALSDAESHMAMPGPTGGIRPFSAAPWNLESHQHELVIPETEKRDILNNLFTL